ncbi:putative ccch zinc finger protein [Diaporthe ampelina]|uniref:Putative ccch zinc finger protein n=1 Tax=Diaporthe ampelina TaxID=1214573 RepID=A0A0G2FSY2_9PEZI|nr:putative ccch zinc finger protein [Diaporthe ampelina]
MPFRVANNGSKLVKLPGDLNGPKATPKMALVGGVKFHRSKNGNMYRQAIVKAHRQSAAIKKTNVTCRNFSNTAVPIATPSNALTSATQVFNASNDDVDDLSSDDDKNSVSSDDVDSDEVEEFVGEEDPTDFEKDFISFI